MLTEKFIKLLKQIHKGNMDALLPIFSEYYGKMIVTARYILHNDQDAEDAAADVIVKIIKYAKANKKPKIENAGAYINKAIRNSAINIYNKKRNTVFSDFVDEIAATTSDMDTLIDNIDLWQAIETLPDEYKTIAVMFYFYDCKVKHIAEELSIPEGTIKWKLSIIRENLYKKLK